MQKFRLFMKKFVKYAGRYIYSALFLAISLMAISIISDQNAIRKFRNEANVANDGRTLRILAYAADALGFDEAENGKEYTVFVDDAGVVSAYRTSAKSVNAFLEENSIEIGIYDEVIPFGNAALLDGMTVMITRVDYVTETLKTVLPYETVIEDVDTIEKDKILTVRNGVDGVTLDTYRIRVVNGAKTDDIQTVSKKIITEPINCIKQRGVGGVFVAPDGTQYEYSYRLEVKATAYYDAYHRGMTATGHAAVPGVVAVDKDVIPLHSKLYTIGEIGDFKVLKAEDVGNFRGNRIDIFFNTIEECYAFGAKNMDVYVIEVDSCGTRRHRPEETADIGYEGADWYYSRKGEQ